MDEILLNEAIIEEREQGIQEIQHQILEVNEIFKDLAVLVHGQGAMIGTPSVLDSDIYTIYIFFKAFSWFLEIYACSIMTNAVSVFLSLLSDDISSNIESSHSATKIANSQLLKASKTQKSSQSMVNFDQCNSLFISFFLCFLVFT